MIRISEQSKRINAVLARYPNDADVRELCRLLDNVRIGLTKRTRRFRVRLKQREIAQLIAYYKETDYERRSPVYNGNFILRDLPEFGTVEVIAGKDLYMDSRPVRPARRVLFMQYMRELAERHKEARRIEAEEPDVDE